MYIKTQILSGIIGAIFIATMYKMFGFEITVLGILVFFISESVTISYFERLLKERRKKK